MIYVRNDVEVKVKPTRAFVRDFSQESLMDYLNDPNSFDHLRSASLEGFYEFAVLVGDKVVKHGTCEGFQSAYDAANHVHDEYEKTVSENGS